MIKKIDHLGIAVKNIGKSLKIYQDYLGLNPLPEEMVEEQKVKVVSLPVGKTNIELLEPTSLDSAVAKFLEKRGEGIHHIAFNVENLEQLLAQLEEKGVTLIDKKPRIGAQGKKIAFIHPKSTGGILIELCEG